MERPRKNTKPYDGMKALAVKATALHFKVTESYVRIILNGDKQYRRSGEIKIFFDEKYAELQKIMG